MNQPNPESPALFDVLPGSSITDFRHEVGLLFHTSHAPEIKPKRPWQRVRELNDGPRTSRLIKTWEITSIQTDNDLGSHRLKVRMNFSDQDGEVLAQIFAEEIFPGGKNTDSYPVERLGLVKPEHQTELEAAIQQFVHNGAEA